MGEKLVVLITPGLLISGNAARRTAHCLVKAQKARKTEGHFTAHKGQIKVQWSGLTPPWAQLCARGEIRFFTEWKLSIPAYIWDLLQEFTSSDIFYHDFRNHLVLF